MIFVFSQPACTTLWGPTDCSPLGSSVHGISQARILKWVAISFSRGSSWPRDQTHVSCIARWILYHWDTWEALHLVCCAVLSYGELFATPWTVARQAPLSIGILQARILEWIVMPSSRSFSIAVLYFTWKYLGSFTFQRTCQNICWAMLYQTTFPSRISSKTLINCCCISCPAIPFYHVIPLSKVNGELLVQRISSRFLHPTLNFAHSPAQTFHLQPWCWGALMGFQLHWTHSDPSSGDFWWAIPQLFHFNNFSSSSSAQLKNYFFWAAAFWPPEVVAKSPPVNSSSTH